MLRTRCPTHRMEPVSDGVMRLPFNMPESRPIGRKKHHFWQLKESSGTRAFWLRRTRHLKSAQWGAEGRGRRGLRDSVDTIPMPLTARGSSMPTRWGLFGSLRPLGGCTQSIVAINFPAICPNSRATA